MTHNLSYDEAHYRLLAEATSKMYRMLLKIASNKEVWSLKEVRDLLKNVSHRNIIFSEE